MDDVEDNSELRRGTPVAHTIYGVPQTINTANYVYFQAVQELLQLQRASPSTSTSKSTSGDEGEGKGEGHTVSKKGKGKEKEDLIGLVTGTSTFPDLRLGKDRLTHRGIAKSPSGPGFGFVLEGLASMSNRRGIRTYGPRQ
jgi:hypothetical protein